MPDPRPYVAGADVSFGDMELPAWTDLDEVIRIAGDDMDAVLGTRYRLPLDLDPNVQSHLSIIKMLAKINRYLTIGRVVIDSAIGGEDTQLQSYGIYHIRAAEQALKSLGNGDVLIPDQVSVLPDDSDRVTGPMVTNRDKGSFLDSFYGEDPFYETYDRAPRGRC